MDSSPRDDLAEKASEFLLGVLVWRNIPLAFGIETPESSALDWLLDNAGLRALAVNLIGLYELYPSGPFGSWLTVDGVAFPAGPGVADFVDEIGGNVPLLDRAVVREGAMPMAAATPMAAPLAWSRWRSSGCCGGAGRRTASERGQIRTGG
jgi:hypothetical protein